MEGKTYGINFLIAINRVTTWVINDYLVQPTILNPIYNLLT
jgi:hypothetical protein